MKDLLTDAADYLREKGQGTLQRLLAQVPFLLMATAIGLLAAVWGLHETRLLLVRSGVARFWEDQIGRGLGYIRLGDAATLAGRTLWALVRSFVLPALTITSSLLSGAMRLGGAVFPRVAPRVWKGSWGTLGIGVLILLLDVLL